MSKPYDEVLGDIIEYLEENYRERGEPAFFPNSRLIEDINIESVERAEIVAELEDEYQIRIPIETIMNLNTIDDLARIVSELIGS